MLYSLCNLDIHPYNHYSIISFFMDTDTLIWSRYLSRQSGLFAWNVWIFVVCGFSKKKRTLASNLVVVLKMLLNEAWIHSNYTLDYGPNYCSTFQLVFDLALHIFKNILHNSIHKPLYYSWHYQVHRPSKHINSNMVSWQNVLQIIQTMEI